MDIEELKSRIEVLEKEAKQESESVNDRDSFVQWKSKYIGRKGKFRDLFSSLKDIPGPMKPVAGQALNATRENLEKLASDLDANIGSQAKQKRSSSDVLDITLPGRIPHRGRKHPLRQITEEIVDIFISMGFDVALGPEVETDYYNFEALNIPSYHPARDMHDTFYLDNGRLLRTHTSPVQVRYMENNSPPVKIVAPGRVYRCDSDVTHSPMFTQIEGLLVDHQITFGDLKGCLEAFLHRIFPEDTPVRFRPSYFPFTEPSAEVDIGCQMCDGSGCRVCSNTGWLEVLGSGMVHPEVFRMVNIDPEQYTGFAFGMGVERLAMLRFGFHDIRLFYENDLRVLEQF